VTSHREAAERERARRSRVMAEAMPFSPYGRPEHDGRVRSPFWQMTDPAWLRREYIERGRTIDDLAAEVGCSVSTIGYHLRRQGIRKRAEFDEEWLRRRHVHERATVAEMAVEVGVSYRVILRALHRHGIPLVGRRQARIEQLHDLAWLRAQIAAGRSQRDIAAELGCSKSAVSMVVARRLR
jgi:hypothetical protein